MNAKEIIAQIAKRNNTTEKQVEEEIKAAIREAMASKDPKAQALWKQISPDGKEPTIDAFLDFCAAELNRRMDKK